MSCRRFLHPLRRSAFWAFLSPKSPKTRRLFLSAPRRFSAVWVTGLGQGKDAENIAKELNVLPDEELYSFVRLRTGNNTPIVLQYTYIPTKFIKHFDLSSLDNSLDEYIKSLGYEISGFVTRLRAVEGSDEQMELLETTSRAILNSVSIRYIENKQIFLFGTAGFGKLLIIRQILMY